MVIEVGGHSRWLSVLLEDLGHRVTITNPRRVRVISQSDSKTDKHDADLLARLGRVDVDLLAPVIVDVKANNDPSYNSLSLRAPCISSAERRRYAPTVPELIMYGTTVSSGEGRQGIVLEHHFDSGLGAGARFPHPPMIGPGGYPYATVARKTGGEELLQSAQLWSASGCS